MSDDETEFPDSTDSFDSTDDSSDNLSSDKEVENQYDPYDLDGFSTDEYVDYVEAAIQISVILGEEAENQHELCENKACTSEGTVEQTRFNPATRALSSVNVDVCQHPGSFEGLCIYCGQKMDEDSGLTFGYIIHKGLKLHDEEISRVRSLHTRNLLNRRKLCLVLDLDHTLLNTTSLQRLSPEEMHLKTHIDSLEDITSGRLFILKHIKRMTKLRPFVRTFLREASEMFEMYINTMGDQRYSLEMARLLDPQGEYFRDKVISRDDGTETKQKDLNLVMGTKSSILILDDKKKVWRKHKDNLILMERYHFFSSSCQEFNLNCKSLAQLYIDESETDGALSRILQVLRQINSKFFDELQGDLVDRDVRQVLSSLRGEVLSGCVIVFSCAFHGQDLRKLRRIADRLGATRLKELGPTVTHVVANEFVTEESMWAEKENKFLINRRWLEASNFFLQKQPEENYIVRKTQ